VRAFDTFVECRRCDFEIEGKGIKIAALQQIITPKRHGKRHASSNRSESLVQMADGRWQFSDGGGCEKDAKNFIIYNIYII
jgi:hypothetical protein